MTEELLTETELEVVKRLANGNKWVAGDLGIAIGTVKNHIRAIAQRLAIPGRGSKRLLIMHRCVAMGLVGIDDFIIGEERHRIWLW